MHLQISTEEEKRLSKPSTSKGPLQSKKSKSKPIHLKDYQRNALLANGGLHYKNDQLTVGATSNLPTPAQEAEDLRSETKAVFLRAVDGGEASDEDEDTLLVKREVQADSVDEDDHRRFLLENVGEEEVERALALRRQSDKLEQEVSGGYKDNEDLFLKKYE